jgi:hypothetical protein
LIERHSLADIDPSFKGDTDIIPAPPEQPAFCNREKIIEREVEIYWKQTEFVCVYHGIGLAKFISPNAQFAANIEEQQTSYGMFDHVALPIGTGRAGFGTSGNA